eukprot:Gb_16209 [translate_table: standard]
MNPSAFRLTVCISPTIVNLLCTYGVDGHLRPLLQLIASLPQLKFFHELRHRPITALWCHQPVPQFFYHASHNNDLYRKLAIRLALGDTSGLPDEDSEGNSTRHMIEEEDDDEDPDHVSTVDACYDFEGTFTYEDGDTTTIVKTCELQSDKGDIETPHLKSFPNTKSKSKVHIPVKKQKHFKRLRKGKKGMKGKKVNKDSSKRLGKRGKHKQ